MPKKIAFKKVRFGTAGIPLSTENPSTERGIEKVRELNLDAMELEFVRGINVTIEKAKIIKKIAEENDVVLTAHGPYYINLNASEEKKWYASIERIINSAKILHYAGGYSVVFHPAYYMKSTKEEAYKKVRDALNIVVETIKKERYDVWIRPETMGKPTQFGDLDELISLSKELEGYVLPVIDFAHLHARYNGFFKSYEDFAKIFERLENELGKYALKNMHIHISGIEYNEKGEKRHLNLKESDLLYKAFVEALINYDVRGVVISESPNIEGDALLLKKEYESLL